MPAWLIAAGKALLGLGTKAAAIMPAWAWLAAGLGLALGVQTLRLANAHADIAAEKLRTAAVERDFAAYQTRVATQAAADQQKAIDALKTWQAMTEAATAARMTRLQQENAELQNRLTEIANVAPEQDGPVADVLCGSLVRLRLATSCAAADRRH